MGASIRLMVSILLGAGSVQAQQMDPAPWRAPFDACVSGRSGDELLACTGTAAGPCMETSDGGTTFGMTACMAMEGALWDDLLNEIWPGLMAGAKAADADNVDFQGGVFAVQAASLLKAQRAWIAYRDAECERVWSSFGGGSMRGPASAACVRDLTAERVARLTDLGAGAR